MKGLLSSRLLKGPSGVKRLSKSLYRQTKLRKRSRRSAFIRRRVAAEPDKFVLQVKPSVFEEEDEGEEEEEEEEEGEDEEEKVEEQEEEEEEEEEEGDYCNQGEIAGGGVVGINAARNKFSVAALKANSHTGDYHDDIDYDGEDDDSDDNDNDDDDITFVEITGNAGRGGKEEGGSGANECDNDDDDDEDDDYDEHEEVYEEDITKAEGNTEGLEEEEEAEEEEQGKDGAEEDFSHVASGPIDRAWDVPPFDDSCNVQKEVIMVEDSLVDDANMQEEDADANGKDFPKGPIISSDWEAAMSSVAETPAAIAFICGGKNTGKSTFARCLVNSLLNRYGKVGFLDTDVGQPEFTPSGCLSLHVLDKPIVGLPALEMKDPERCYFFGDISPKSNPEDYLNSIFSLYDHFKNKYILNYSEGEVNVLKEGRFPIVINTHGWIQGVGFEALIKIIDHVMPTHIVQILSKTPSRNLPLNRFWESGTINPCNSQLLYINNALGESTHLAEIKFDARELRDLRLLSYFQKHLKDKLMPTSRLSVLFENAATALACCKPFQVPISAIKVVHQHFQVPACESVYSLNAALVGLGVSDDGLQYIKPRCVGLGIVRAVDVSRGVFYVITPLKLEALQQVDTFLQGRMDIPVSLLKAPGYVSPYLCNNNISIEGTGSAVMGKGKKKALRLLRTSATL